MSFYGEKSGGDVKFRKSFTSNPTPTIVTKDDSTQIENKKEEDEEIKLVNARTESTDIAINLNKTQVVQNMSVNRQPGFYCQVCDCTMKDSSAYLNHINGRNHIRHLGKSMRVEKSSFEQVKSRLEYLKRKAREPEQLGLSEKIQARVRAEELQKNEKKLQKVALKQELQAQQVKERSHAFGSLDSDMAAIMGFSSFDSQKT